MKLSIIAVGIASAFIASSASAMTLVFDVDVSGYGVSHSVRGPNVMEGSSESHSMPFSFRQTWILANLRAETNTFGYVYDRADVVSVSVSPVSSNVLAFSGVPENAGDGPWGGSYTEAYENKRFPTAVWTNFIWGGPSGIVFNSDGLAGRSVYSVDMNYRGGLAILTGQFAETFDENSVFAWSEGVVNTYDISVYHIMDTFTYGGFARLNLALSSIPDAETWLLMTGGLGAMGAILRRRRRDIAAAPSH